jgi:ribosomal protein S18 acetylase RimI-like enzyme
MIFQDSLPTIEAYWNLFETTGWNKRYNLTLKELESAIEKSWYSSSIYDSDKLIGFGRVISDGVHHAFIVDLMIHPDYQNQGLGSQLLNRLVSKCQESKIKDIQLFSAKDKSGFYEKLGFEKRPENAPGMQLRNH